MLKPTKLKPMPIRVTPQQHAALNQLRAEDGASAQEHVRRAIDLYLAKKKREKTTAAGGGAGEEAAQPATVPENGMPQQPPVTAEERTARQRYGFR